MRNVIAVAAMLVAAAALPQAATAATHPNTRAPKVAGETARWITNEDAVLHGRIRTGNLPTTWYFQVGEAGTYELLFGCHEGCEVLWLGDRLREASLPAAAGADGVSADIWDENGLLSPGAEYHYRLVASNALGVTYGPDRTFTTKS